MADNDQGRRRFLKLATGILGGSIGAVLAYPLMRYVFYPVGRKIVAEAGEPIDAIGVEALEKGAPPIRVQLTAKSVRDAWSVTQDVPLGAAWVRRDAAGEVHALSSICPHLGCAVAFVEAENTFKCPCHRSAFSPEGEKLGGPSKRGLDPLPVEVKGGRVLIKFVRFRPDVPGREPV